MALRLSEGLGIAATVDGESGWLRRDHRTDDPWGNAIARKGACEDRIPEVALNHDGFKVNVNAGDRH